MPNKKGGIMRTRKKSFIILGAMLIGLLLISGCAPGNERFVEGPAGFWAGLWHGFIVLFTFIISLFSDSVQIYESSNTGGWYDLGFLLGACAFFSNGARQSRKARHRKCKHDEEWDEIGAKVEEKIKRGIASWAEEADDKKEEWEEIGKKIEEKIKRELSDWADK
jgi:gas vesicle protein